MQTKGLSPQQYSFLVAYYEQSRKVRLITMLLFYIESTSVNLERYTMYVVDKIEGSANVTVVTGYLVWFTI